MFSQGAFDLAAQRRDLGRKFIVFAREHPDADRLEIERLTS